MADLIEKEEVLDILQKYYYIYPTHTDEFAVLCRVEDDIRDLLQSDTERHAHWIFQSETSSAFDKKYKCSECLRVITICDEKDLINYPYCHCGCKMDEVIE